MSRNMAPVLAVAVVAMLTPSAYAADAPEPAATELHLMQTATRMMAPDRIRATLRLESSGKDARVVQADLNRRMQSALDKAKSVSAVTAEAGGYAVYRSVDPKDHGTWHAVETLVLSSSDFGTTLALAGELQEAGAFMSGVQFLLAPETFKSVEGDLTASALAGLKQRANAVAADLGMTVDHYKALNAGNADVPGRPEFFSAPMAAASVASPPPVAEPADITVSLTVTADIILAPAKN
jgi:uncharacterized protein